VLERSLVPDAFMLSGSFTRTPMKFPRKWEKLTAVDFQRGSPFAKCVLTQSQEIERTPNGGPQVRLADDQSRDRQ
jgi:hypothetical protein